MDDKQIKTALGYSEGMQLPTAEDLPSDIGLSPAVLAMRQLREDVLAQWHEDWGAALEALEEYLVMGALSGLSHEQVIALQDNIRQTVSRNAFGAVGAVGPNNPLIRLLDESAYKAHDALDHLMSLIDAAELRFGAKSKAGLARLIREIDGGQYTVITNPSPDGRARGLRFLLKAEVHPYGG